MKIARVFIYTAFVGCFVINGLNDQQTQRFTNPILPAGADPWCTYKNGYYYYTNTTGRNITVWKTKSIARLQTAEKKVVFNPPAKGPYSKEIWAPEIHFLAGKWYIYFAADSGNNVDHRLWVLENSSPDPLQGEWVLKGKLTTPDDKWSIDGSVYNHKGKLYLIWSGWEGDTNGRQDIYIAAMSNPWTVTGKRVLLSKPELEWETHGDLNNPNDVPHVDVNEGPQILEYGNRLFLIYSASGCWTEHYSLGMLTSSATADLMDSTSWKKNPLPVFKQSPENKVYAPGHNSFFRSPDGTEYWILYHANDKPGLGCGKWRSPRAQRFIWTKDGTPYFGRPVATNVSLAIPSEKKKVVRKRKTPVLENR
ncbi:MAG: glycoside hydrolase family 43 protein [Chitinophagaceae bacterium]|nr:glycoside hydrolase family 43 protein [Chitinophagaceae bacterium]